MPRTRSSAGYRPSGGTLWLSQTVRAGSAGLNGAACTDTAASVAVGSNTSASVLILGHTSTGIGTSNGTPAVANGILYTSGEGSFLNALSASTGLLEWTTAQFATGQSSTPVVADGVVYVGDATGHLAAYGATRTAKCIGTTPVCPALWTAHQQSAAQTPAIVDGTVYVSGQPSGSRISAYHL
jgi:outer membrane protein assembly factor BamB